MRKRFFLTMMALVAMTTLFAQQSENPRGTIELSDEERVLVNKNNAFAFRLLQKVREEKNESMILSPLSVTYALGMLNNGATGETQEQINKVLGFGDAGADAINNFCRKMLTRAIDLDELTKVMISNTIFVNAGLGYELKPDFVSKAKDYYDATPEARDFNDGKTLDVINQWAADHTEQLITEVLTESTFNPYAVSYLLNAIYFKGPWTFPFYKELTIDEPFNGGENVPMMRQTFRSGNGELSARYEDFTPHCQMLTIPYGNGAYQLQILLPYEEQDIDDLLDMFAKIKSGELQIFDYGGLYSGYDVDVKLPRFDTTTDVGLNDIMSDLGMPDAFSPSKAEFDEFCYLPDGERVYVGLMKQSAKIKLDEDGTEAAAVTVIGADATAIDEPEPPRIEFYANRPFIYVLTEQSTGAIFFIGQYVGDGPATAIEAPTLRRSDTQELYNLQGQKVTHPQRGRLYISHGKKIIY